MIPLRNRENKPVWVGCYYKVIHDRSHGIVRDRLGLNRICAVLVKYNVNGGNYNVYTMWGNFQYVTLSGFSEEKITEQCKKYKTAMRIVDKAVLRFKKRGYKEFDDPVYKKDCEKYLMKPVTLENVCELINQTNRFSNSNAVEAMCIDNTGFEGYFDIGGEYFVKEVKNVPIRKVGRPRKDSFVGAIVLAEDKFGDFRTCPESSFKKGK